MNVYDHCDRCGAAGKVQVFLPNGFDLMFCGHHAREYKTTILDIATDVIYDDETLINDLQPA
jgi:hypothetical protein